MTAMPASRYVVAAARLNAATGASSQVVPEEMARLPPRTSGRAGVQEYAGREWEA